MEKLLILRLSAVGDVLRTLPAVKALKERFPASYITWVVEEPARTLLESQPEIDRVILFPRKKWKQGIRSPKEIWSTIGEISRFVSDLRRERYSSVFDFHGVLKSGILSFLSGSHRRIGFDRRSTKEGNFLFSNLKVKLPEERMSRFKRNLALVKGLGIEANGVGHRLHIPSRDRDVVDAFLQEVSPSIRRPFVAIHPGTSSKAPFKRWVADRYAELADRLIRELKAAVLFTWGPDEENGVNRIRSAMKESSILSPRTETLTQLGELFRRCDLYIGGDTGPMHVASFVGTPVVAIFGPTDPVENEPVGRHTKVRRAVGCNPCRKRSCMKQTCMQAIAVDDVFRAAREMLVSELHS